MFTEFSGEILGPVEPLHKRKILRLLVHPGCSPWKSEQYNAEACG
jgi:hypothetical protein